MCPEIVECIASSPSSGGLALTQIAPGATQGEEAQWSASDSHRRPLPRLMRWAYLIDR